MSLLQEIAQALTVGKADQVKELTQKALADKIEPADIINNGLIAGMSEIGVKFKNNEIFLPEVLFAAKAMHAGLDIVKPLLTETNFKPVAKVVLGTVKGDLHDIGKNLVGMMLTGGGFEVIDLGVDASPEKFVEAIHKNEATLVGLSALLTTTMPYMKDIIMAIDNAGLRKKVKIMIGGAPVTLEYANEIGADGYSPDASTAVELAHKLVKSIHE